MDRIRKRDQEQRRCLLRHSRGDESHRYKKTRPNMQQCLGHLQHVEEYTIPWRLEQQCYYFIFHCLRSIHLHNFRHSHPHSFFPHLPSLPCTLPSSVNLLPCPFPPSCSAWPVSLELLACGSSLEQEQLVSGYTTGENQLPSNRS